MPEIVQDEVTFLGMTKEHFAFATGIISLGAWVLTALILAFVVHRDHAAFADLHKTTARQNYVLIQQRNTLADLCVSNRLTADALDNTVELLKHEIRTDLLPPRLQLVLRMHLDVYQSIQLQFAQNIACPEVKP